MAAAAAICSPEKSIPCIPGTLLLRPLSKMCAPRMQLTLTVSRSKCCIAWPTLEKKRDSSHGNYSLLQVGLVVLQEGGTVDSFLTIMRLKFIAVLEAAGRKWWNVLAGTLAAQHHRRHAVSSGYTNRIALLAGWSYRDLYVEGCEEPTNHLRSVKSRFRCGIGFHQAWLAAVLSVAIGFEGCSC